jgi:hypothetical protein
MYPMPAAGLGASLRVMSRIPEGVTSTCDLRHSQPRNTGLKAVGMVDASAPVRREEGPREQSER